MKLFIDTANIDEIKEASRLGLIDGVTTNPTLIAREGKEFMPLVKEICQLVDGPISLEAVSSQSNDMLKEARDLAHIHPNAVVKLPLTRDGLIATKQLATEGIKVNTGNRRD
jgi:transaldolase